MWWMFVCGCVCLPVEFKIHLYTCMRECVYICVCGFVLGLLGAVALICLCAHVCHRESDKRQAYLDLTWRTCLYPAGS